MMIRPSQEEIESVFDKLFHFKPWFNTHRERQIRLNGFLAGYQAATQANKEKLGEVLEVCERIRDDQKNYGNARDDARKAIAKINQLIGDE